MKVLISTICWILLIQIISVSTTEDYLNSQSLVNLTHWREHRRQKRFLVFTHFGTLKLVLALGIPIELGPRRQLGIAYNLQYQYPMPLVAQWWWKLFYHKRSMSKNNEYFWDRDETQEFLYGFIEEFMTRNDMNGHECLLLAICENIQIHKHHGLYGELLHRFLIPHRSLDERYLDAWQMGKHGVDCRQQYTEAQDCFLDQLLYERNIDG